MLRGLIPRWRVNKLLGIDWHLGDADWRHICCWPAPACHRRFRQRRLPGHTDRQGQGRACHRHGLGRNESCVRSLGVDEFVDYTQQPFEQVVRDMDVVFDTVGGDTFQRAFLTVKKGGALVTAVEFPKDEAAQYGVRAARVFCKPNVGQLADIRDLVEAGQLKAHVATVFQLADIREALALSEAGRTRGKIVLQIVAWAGSFSVARSCGCLAADAAAPEQVGMSACKKRRKKSEN